MAEPALNPVQRRLAVYSYLRPLVEGHRVLELGGDADSAAHLRALGAAAVATAETDASGPFDLVVAPDGAALLGRDGLTTARAALAAGGHLVCLVPNGDRPGAQGLGFYDLVDALTPHFPRVRMFGQTTFVACGLAEFDEAPAGLRVDSSLVDESAEQPTHYLAVAGPDVPLSLGYALIQLPAAALGAAAAPLAVPGNLVELRRQLAEAQGQIEGALRVNRAHVEELEELRGRLRRAAEARAELDAEVARLRRALAEADQSVLDLTRRTTEEVASLAQRLSGGLRAETVSPSALAERDDRIAALEAERQDLIWRLDSAEEELRRAGQGAPMTTALERDELVTALRLREQALDEHRRAAQAHVDEVARLRDALTEQSTLVAELEDSLRVAEGRLAAAEEETARLRRAHSEAEEADRQRRSRLAELEGTLLRMQRHSAIDAARSQAGAEAQAAKARAEALEGENRSLRARVAELEARPLQEDPRLAAATAEVERLRGALERSEEQLWEARGRLHGERAPERAPAPARTPELLGEALEQLAALERGLRAEAAQLAAIERSLAEWRAAASQEPGPASATAHES